MAITVDIACIAFIQAVMDNEFTEKVITYSCDDWWSVVVFLNVRKPRVGEHMPLILQGSEYITIQLPDTMAKAGKTFLPERYRLALLKAIEKYGRKEVPKKIEAYVVIGKFTKKDRSYKRFVFFFV
jgi:hypothetical protein